MNSKIYTSWLDYVQECGPSLQGEQNAAIDQYKTQFGNPPTDPDSLDFINWAIDNFIPYKSAFASCQQFESRYQQLLATFIPDAPPSASATSTQATDTGHPPSSPTSSTPAANGAGGNGRGPSTGSAVSCDPRAMLVLTCLGAVLAIHKYF